MAKIPYNRPHLTGNELQYIAQAVANLHLSANGEFTAQCQSWLEQRLGAARVFLTHSCTAALEMAALLVGVEAGDEVIMPSFTFVSTANAVVLRGGAPVFVDVRPDTLNLDESLIEAAITPRTRAICPVHYGGVAANLNAICAIAARHNLVVVEDAAQGLFASWQGRPLGTIGALGAISFHETKNVISGEGGALIVNDPSLVSKAETIWEKGTDRAQFRSGEIDRYTWQSIGSSFAPSEITSAFLWAQLQHGEAITARRLVQWERYHTAFAELEDDGMLQRPMVPRACEHNGHLYRLLLPSAEAREEMIADLGRAGIQAVFHYVPLHNSPAGLRYGRASGSLRVTEDAAARLVRLPLHASLTEAEQTYIIEAVYSTCRKPAVCL
jgi:dTDP-4-amino-4,6-dideoxygalactose transaminase